MSLLLFSLYFDWAVHHIHQKVESMHIVQVGSMNIAALYADEIILLAPFPTSLQLQLSSTHVNSLHLFFSLELPRISSNKTLIQHINTSSDIQLDGTQLKTTIEALD